MDLISAISFVLASEHLSRVPRAVNNPRYILRTAVVTSFCCAKVGLWLSCRSVTLALPGQFSKSSCRHGRRHLATSHWESPLDHTFKGDKRRERTSSGPADYEHGDDAVGEEYWRSNVGGLNLGSPHSIGDKGVTNADGDWFAAARHDREDGVGRGKRLSRTQRPGGGPAHACRRSAAGTGTARGRATGEKVRLAR